ncbi:MAG: 3-dehydroquinate synthase [Pseudomonadota bacterium]
MTTKKTVSVDLGERSYDIHIGKALLEQTADLLPSSLKDNLKERHVFILYDENVYPYAQVIDEALAGKTADTKMFAMKGGEQTKSYEGFETAMEWLLEKGVNRQSILIALGGGVIGDLGGFVAASVMRGIAYVQIPTTLLSQIDSSVGGKTGINTPQGKNLVGAFYQPKTVICDVGTLGTLPERELKAGYAEMSKYGLINDVSFYDWLSEHGEDVLSLKGEELIHAIEVSCKAKADIVAADEREAGQRALLNLGHTFGHALEAAAKYDGRLLHGEAIAMGIVMAADLSVQMGLTSAETLNRIIDEYQTLGMKTKASEIDPTLDHSAEEIIELMSKDKKVKGDKIGFILMKGIGQSFQTYDIDEDKLLNVVKHSLGVVEGEA